MDDREVAVDGARVIDSSAASVRPGIGWGAALRHADVRAERLIADTYHSEPWLNANGYDTAPYAARLETAVTEGRWTDDS